MLLLCVDGVKAACSNTLALLHYHFIFLMSFYEHRNVMSEQFTLNRIPWIDAHLHWTERKRTLTLRMPKYNRIGRTTTVGVDSPLKLLLLALWYCSHRVNVCVCWVCWCLCCCCCCFSFCSIGKGIPPDTHITIPKYINTHRHRRALKHTHGRTPFKYRREKKSAHTHSML